MDFEEKEGVGDQHKDRRAEVAEVCLKEKEGIRRTKRQKWQKLNFKGKGGGVRMTEGQRWQKALDMLPQLRNELIFG